MKESAQAALSWVRAHANGINPELPDDWFAKHDIHVHVPAGAVPKDGPSAGVAMATALASLITNRPVRNDVAMTGEITLTGQVLPIGGLKEKSLAAQRAGIKQVIVPDRNEGDVEEISEEERRGLEFVYADDIGDVLKTALELDGEGAETGWKSSERVVCICTLENDLRRPMGAQSRSAKAGDAARSVASNPYVRRLIEDAELRENIRVAFEAAKGAYARMSNGKGPAKALMDDKKVQRDLRQAAESLRDASQQLRGKQNRPPVRARKGPARGDPRRGPGPDSERGRAQDGAGQAVRRGGGVRVHLDHHPGAGHRDGSKRLTAPSPA